MRPHLVTALFALSACSGTTEGPTPTVTGTINPRQRNIKPARVCNAQGGERGWRVELLGERFAPIPQDVLTDGPTAGLPQVTLQGPETLRLDRSSVFYRDSTLLLLELPTKDSTPAVELPAGSYSVEVKNLGGGTGALSDSLIIVPPPTVTQATAPQGFSFTAPSPLVVEGTGFRTDTFPPMKMVQRGAPEVEVETFVLEVESPTRISTEIPPGTLAGTYDFVLTNPEGCSFTLPNALTVIY